MPKLYEIAGQVRAVLGRVEDLETQEEALELLEELQDTLERRVEWVGLRVLELGHEIDAVQAEAKRLQGMAATMDRQRTWLKQYLGMVLERADMKRVDGNLCKVRRQKTPPSVILTTQVEAVVESGGDLREVLPPEVVRVIPERTEVDKRAILTIYKDTGKLPEGVLVDETKEAVVVW